MTLIRTHGSRLLRSVPFQLLVFAIASRLALVLAGWYTLKLIPPPWVDRPRLLVAWAQWDAAHYGRIALNGYDHPVEPGSPAFFPLYPLITRGVADVAGRTDTIPDLMIVGVLVSWVFFLLAVVLLGRLFELHLGADVARTAGVLLLVSPYSFFLTTAYTESLFMVLVALAFLLAHWQRWPLAVVVVALATATRINGVFLIPTLLFVAWRHRESIRTLAMIAAVSPLGLIAYMVYTWRVLDNPLAFIDAQEGWGGFQERTWRYVQGFADHPLSWFLGAPGHPVMLLNVGLFIVWIACLVPMIRLVPMEITLFSGLIMLQAAFSIESMGRYLLPAIGVYMVAAVLLHRARTPALLRDAIIVPSAVVMTMLFLLFAEAEWII